MCTYHYHIVLDQNGEKLEFHPEVSFSKDTSKPYSSGYSMIVRNMPKGSEDVVDCLHNLMLNPKHLDQFFFNFVAQQFDGEDGSCRLISISLVD